MMKFLQDIGLIVLIDHILHIVLDLVEDIAVMKVMYHILRMFQDQEEIQIVQHLHMEVIVIIVTMLLIRMLAIIMLQNLLLEHMQILRLQHRFQIFP